MMYGLPQWGNLLIGGIMICLMMCFFAVILARMGRNPYWAVIVVLPVFVRIPFVIPLMFWVMAYISWSKPTFKKRKLPE